MTPRSARRLPRGLLVLAFVTFCSLSVLAGPNSVQPANRAGGDACEELPAVRAFPEVRSECSPPLEYLGEYASDGKYKPMTKMSRASNGAWVPLDQERQGEVPPGIHLHSLERVIENYELPAHAQRTIHEHSIFSAARDEIVTFAYGWEKVLQSPHHLTTDSTGRILITDANAVHVLNGRNSFRIAGGPHRRFQSPAAIAVDARDNIYVVDSERALVLVYDRDGRFLKSLGRRGNESIFHLPAAIAVDPAAERIYLIDTLRSTLFVLDLEGNVIRRIGKHHENGTPIEFDRPTAIVLAHNELVILDQSGQRIQILAPDGKLIGQFETGVTGHESPTSEMGLGVDSEGNIYISNVGNSIVRVYDHSGHRIGAFGAPGMDLGEFLSPKGVWIDSTHRLFVADTNNRRIQVFRLGSSAQHTQPGE